MGFHSYSPQSQLVHCSKQSRVYLAGKILSQQVRRRKGHIVLVAALATLLGCAPLAEVREINPRLGAQHGTVPQLQRTEQQIANGQELKRSDPDRAVGFYLASIESATSQLRNDPKDRIALRDYNFALSRVFSATRDAHLDPWTRPLHVPAPNGGEYLLTNRVVTNFLWRPQDYELIRADELDVRGKFVVPRVTREGAGASLVAVRGEEAPPIFKPRRDVARIIFISTPHRGSVIAQNSIGRIGSSLIRKSVRYMNASREILQASVVQEDPAAEQYRYALA